MQGEAERADIEATARDPEGGGEVTQEGGHTAPQSFSADQTAFSWKKMPSRTFTARQKSVPGFKGQADSLVGGNAVVTKLNPMLIYHLENPKALKK